MNTITVNHHGQERTLRRVAAGRPWYLRITVAGREEKFRLDPRDRQAITQAREILDHRAANSGEFAAFLATRHAARSVTVGALADEWLGLDCPFNNREPRGVAAAEAVADPCRRALDFWRTVPVAEVNRAKLDAFADHRHRTARAGFTGARSTDIQLAALSSLCQWAVSTGRIAENPFRQRDQYATATRHCSMRCPENDTQFHAILDALNAGSDDDRAAAKLLHFSALTGLRTGEVKLVRSIAHIGATLPARDAEPGTIYTAPNGEQRMRVPRLKRGQNPEIIVHVELADFIARNLSVPMFREVELNARLKRACARCNLPPMTPHGFGRAYFVKVQRSQGRTDEQIATMLGQRSNGALIRSVYGDPGDGVGNGAHDWIL